MKTIANLRLGEVGYVSEESLDAIPLKLLEMGCLPGSEVQLVQIAPLKDPLYICVNGSHLAIRKETEELQNEMTRQGMEFMQDVITPAERRLGELVEQGAKLKADFNKKVERKFRGVQVKVSFSEKHINIELGSQELLYVDTDGRCCWEYITETLKDNIISEWKELYS